MTRDEIRELAAFQADESKGACALSFYFQPEPPQDRSHRNQAIVAKDVVKQALKSAAAQGQEWIGACRSGASARNRRQPARARTVKRSLPARRKMYGESMNCRRGWERHEFICNRVFS